MIIKLYNLFFLTATLPELNFKHSPLITSLVSATIRIHPLCQAWIEMGCLKMRQRGHEESERTLERDNKLEKKESVGQRQKRGKTKDIKEQRMESEQPLPVWMSPSWPSWCEEIVLVHTPVFEANTLEWTRLTGWRQVIGKLSSIFRFGWESFQSLDLDVPRSCRVPPAKTGADLWNIMHLCFVAKQDAGLCRIKACGGHERIAQSHQAESSFLLPGWIPLIFHRQMLGVAPSNLLCFI